MLFYFLLPCTIGFVIIIQSTYLSYVAILVIYVPTENYVLISAYFTLFKLSLATCF